MDIEMVRIGTVTDTDTVQKKVRVKFQDENTSSGWLPVLQNAGSWLPKVNETVLILFVPVWQGDGYVLGRISQ